MSKGNGNSIYFGYEYNENEKCRYKRIVEGQLQYDNEFKTNNFGFVSGFDYALKKLNSGQKTRLSWVFDGGRQLHTYKLALQQQPIQLSNF